MQRRAARNRIIVLVVVGLLIVSLVASAAVSGGLFGGDDDTVEPPPEDDEVPEATAGPCGETPDDVPEVDSATYDEPFDLTISQDATYVATLATTCGDIVIELDAQNAPIATNNFVNLAREGFYDGIFFHRVIPDFVIQGGDPQGTGGGGPGYSFEDELDRAEELYAEVEEALLADLPDVDDEPLPEELLSGGYPRGTVAMANSGPDTNGSQFFIAQGDPTQLPAGALYTVFGVVLEGMDVVDDIATSPTTGAEGMPVEPVVIRSVTIEES